MDLYREIVKVRDEGRRAALATIVRRLGSAPRKDAAKMLIFEDGSSLGSVGGGCVEAEVWDAAREVMVEGRARLIKYELTEEDAENEGLVCGGSVEVFVEAILPDPRLVILGAGHLGQAVARLAHEVGFAVIVVDDRTAFASPERFPDVERIIVAPFESGLDDVRIDANTYLLIVTRGHKHDQIATEQAIRRDARYVGLVGSRRKIKIIVEALLAKGYGTDRFDRFYAPIGLDIGSESPEEIAVSVVAELIAVRKNAHRRNEKQEFITKLLAGRATHAEG